MCLNRNFALRFIRDRTVAAPNIIGKRAFLAHRTREATLTVFFPKSLSEF